MKKFLLLLPLTLIFFAARQAGPDAQNDPNAPVITFEHDTVNFDTIVQGTTIRLQNKFTNTGKTPLVISNIYSTDGGFYARASTEPIAPGKSGVIECFFNSTGKMGGIHKVATISSNSILGTDYFHFVGFVKAPPPPPATGARGESPENK